MNSELRRELMIHWEKGWRYYGSMERLATPLRSGIGKAIYEACSCMQSQIGFRLRELIRECDQELLFKGGPADGKVEIAPPGYLGATDEWHVPVMSRPPVLWSDTGADTEANLGMTVAIYKAERPVWDKESGRVKVPMQFTGER